MIILRQREFAIEGIADLIESEDILTRCPLELMKMIEMTTFNGGMYLDHWRRKFKKGLSFFEKYDFSPQCVFAPAVENNYRALDRVFGRNVVGYLMGKYRNPEGFIQEIQNKILTERASGEPKYDTWFSSRGFKYPGWKDYQFIYKTVALGFGNQISQDVLLYPWENLSLISNMKVKYTGTQDVDISGVLRYDISGFTGNI